MKTAKSSQQIPAYSRYRRQIRLPEVGLKGQEKLRSASVLVVGAGGLGCPALLYLIAAGIGKIGIVDGDRVELSNLQRQVLYSEEDVGELKSEIASRKLKNHNSDVNLSSHNFWLSNDNVMETLTGYDIVIDGTDNFPTRYLINDACIFMEKPFIYGSVYRFEGQLSLFNYAQPDGTRGPNYRDLFPEPPPAELVPDCSDAGVMGVLPGIIGTMQANEVIKWITGMDGLMSGRLLIFDAVQCESQVVSIPKRIDNPVTGKNPSITRLIDYEHFCNPANGDGVDEISTKELKNWIKTGKDFRLIDVRQPEEYEVSNLGGELIPLLQINHISEDIRSDQPVVFYCRTGRRSAEAIRKLNAHEKFNNLYNLKGGMESWKRMKD
ncbi:MAG: ThiF family adenylyltransferase [Balneolaceae bacterium]|nr:ThiF family adenylyltransferase [Balneolaceae bacterium]